MGARFTGAGWGMSARTPLLFGSLMSVLRKEQHDQAKYEPRRKLVDIEQGRVRYAIYRHRRKRRNLRFRIAALIIFAVGIGVVVALLANWLSP
jgi:hypothetical protein